MYIRSLIPWNFAELAKTVPIAGKVVYSVMATLRMYHINIIRHRLDSAKTCTHNLLDKRFAVDCIVVIWLLVVYVHMPQSHTTDQRMAHTFGRI